MRGVVGRLRRGVLGALMGMEVGAGRDERSCESTIMFLFYYYPGESYASCEIVFLSPVILQNG